MPPSQSAPAAKAAAKKAAAAKPAVVENKTEPKPLVETPADAAPAEDNEATEATESNLPDDAKALALEALAAAEAEQKAAQGDSDAEDGAEATSGDTDPLGDALTDGCEGPEHDPAVNAECDEAPAVDPTKEAQAPAVATLTPPPPAPEPEPEEKFTATLTEAAIERAELAEGVTVLRDFRGNRLDPAKVFSDVEEGGAVRVLTHVVVHTTETEYNRLVRTQLLAPNGFVSVAEARAVREQIAATNAAEDAAAAS